jgi:hypothetical protein
MSNNKTLRKYLFDVKWLNSQITKQQAKELTVYLKKTQKGVGLYANKNIKKGETIAYYKVTARRYDNFQSPFNMEYAIEIFTKNGNSSKVFVGDIYEDTVDPPINGVPFWGYLANEPSMGQKSNAELKTNYKANYMNRGRLSENAPYVLTITAERNIKKDEEVMWCYGYGYERKYRTPCED